MYRNIPPGAVQYPWVLVDQVAIWTTAGFMLITLIPF